VGRTQGGGGRSTVEVYTSLTVLLRPYLQECPVSLYVGDEVVPEVQVGEGGQLAQDFSLHNLQLVAAQVELPELAAEIPAVVFHIVHLFEKIKICE
jgi:hypothetical protein